MSTEPQRSIAQPPSVRLPYSHGRRAFYGLLWTFWTTVLVIGGFSLLFGASALAGLVALGLAALAGRYAWRIWTWQARSLIFFIVF